MISKLFKERTNNTWIQFLRCFFLGGMCFLVDFVTLYILTDFFRIHYLRSASLAFLLGLTTNYFLSVTWVFQKRTFQKKWVEFGLFIFLGVLGLGLNHLLMYLFTDFGSLHYLVSKGIAAGLVFLWNFSTRKVFLFHFVSSSVTDVLEELSPAEDAGALISPCRVLQESLS